MSLHPAAAPVKPFCAFPWSTTATPDWLFDEVAPDLDKAPLKVLLYIVRRTCGFRKLADAISLNQFQHGIVTRDGRHLDKGCGVTNRTTLLHALDELEARGLIAHQDAIHADGGNATTVYYLLGPAQGGGAATAPPPTRQDDGGGVRSAHPGGVRPAHPLRRAGRPGGGCGPRTPRGCGPRTHNKQTYQQTGRSKDRYPLPPLHRSRTHDPATRPVNSPAIRAATTPAYRPRRHPHSAASMPTIRRSSAQSPRWWSAWETARRRGPASAAAMVS